MKVVANSSVLIALSIIGQLELISQRFPEGILIPQAVWDEVVETGKDQYGAEKVKSISWLTVCKVKDENLVSALCIELDKGESEAIALCCEQKADVILLDEKDARRVANRLGLLTLGTVGILIWAKRNGLIDDLRNQLNDLQIRGKFRLSKSVYQQALKSVGED